MPVGQGHASYGYGLTYTLYGTHALSTTCLHWSSEQPIGIVVTLETCLKLYLTNEALICVGAMNAR